MVKPLRNLCISAFVAVLSVGSPLHADDGEDEGSADHHQREAVRGAVERGEIKPLVEVLAAVHSKLPGEIVGVEIENAHGTWTYEFRIADSKGRLFEAAVDAATAEVISIEEK